MEPSDAPVDKNAVNFRAQLSEQQRPDPDGDGPNYALAVDPEDEDPS